MTTSELQSDLDSDHSEYKEVRPESGHFIFGALRRRLRDRRQRRAERRLDNEARRQAEMELVHEYYEDVRRKDDADSAERSGYAASGLADYETMLRKHIKWENGHGKIVIPDEHGPLTQKATHLIASGEAHPYLREEEIARLLADGSRPLDHAQSEALLAERAGLHIAIEDSLQDAPDPAVLQRALELYFPQDA